jgi:DNA-binding FadR family transcriptional regulator
MIPAIVENLSDKQVEEIKKAMNEHMKAASFPQYRRNLMIKDTNFHLAIVACGGNKVIYKLCKLILEQIYLKYRPEYMREDRLKEAAE